MKDLCQGSSCKYILDESFKSREKDTLYGSSVARASCEDICDGTSMARGEL